MSHCKLREAPAFSAERGYVLVSAMVGAMVLSGLLYSSSLVSVVELKDSRRGLDEVRTLYLAQSGVEMATNRLKDAIRKTSLALGGSRRHDYMGSVRSLPRFRRRLPRKAKLVPTLHGHHDSSWRSQPRAPAP